MPTAVILFAVALVAVYAYGRVTEQQAIQRNQELARLSAANLAAEINQFALDLGSLTRQSDIAGNQPAQQEKALAAASNKLSIFDAGTVILDPHGTFVAAWPARPGDVGQDWSSRPYFAQLLRSSRPVYSDIGLDGVEGARVVTVAVPITGPKGEFNGVLAGMFRVGATSVSALYGDIAKLRVGVSGDVYVVDGNGRVIQHPDAALVGMDLMSQKIVQDVVSGQTGAQRTRDLNQRDVVAAYAPVPGTNWGLIAIEDWSTLIRPFQGYRTFLLVLLVLGLLVPSLVVWFGVRRVTRPVQALTGAARKVAAGDFEHSVSITTHDELQELAEQFNIMSAATSRLVRRAGQAGGRPNPGTRHAQRCRRGRQPVPRPGTDPRRCARRDNGRPGLRGGSGLHAPRERGTGRRGPSDRVAKPARRRARQHPHPSP